MLIEILPVTSHYLETMCRSFPVPVKIGLANLWKLPSMCTVIALETRPRGCACNKGMWIFSLLVYDFFVYVLANTAAKWLMRNAVLLKIHK